MVNYSRDMKCIVVASFPGDARDFLREHEIPAILAIIVTPATLFEIEGRDGKVIAAVYDIRRPTICQPLRLDQVISAWLARYPSVPYRVVPW